MRRRKAPAYTSHYRTQVQVIKSQLHVNRFFVLLILSRPEPLSQKTLVHPPPERHGPLEQKGGGTSSIHPYEPEISIHENMKMRHGNQRKLL